MKEEAMTYSITTRDGITIQNIPNDVPPDSPILKERVAQIRAQGEQGTQEPQEERHLLSEGANRLMQGVWSGLAGVAGAPVDLISAGLGVVGLGSDRPIGGSRQLRELAARIPTNRTGARLTYSDIQEVPPEWRPVARAGEVLGGSAPFAALPFMVRRGLSELPAFARPIVRAARETPRRFLGVEAGAAGGAAQGAAFAELVAPGNPTVATGAEIIGGMANPIGLVINTATGAVQRGGALASSFTRAGREDTVAKSIHDAMIAAGENPQRVVSVLREADLPGVSLTAGQKAESPVLLAMERSLTGKNPEFDMAMDRRTQDNFAQLRRLVTDLEATGNPVLLREAAATRDRYFKGVIQERLDTASARMEQAAGRIGGDRAEASVKANQILEEALVDARAQESVLWGKVPKDFKLEAPNVVRAYDELMAHTYRERPQPPDFISAFIARVSGRDAITGDVPGFDAPPQPPLVNSGELLSFRSDMLARARQARAQKDWVGARIYEDMADGALADISSIPGGETAEARAFSRSLHDVFSRTFASDALATKATGQDRIVPEAVLQRAYGSGGALANRRFAELEQAAQFSGKSMIHEQEDFLRAAAAAVVDPQTGRVNPRQLEGFLRENATMLNRYPGLRRDLVSASTAEQSFRQIEAAGEQASRAIAQRAVFSEVLRNENPATAINTVLNSRNPRAGYRQLVNLAQRGPTGAVDGLKAATLDHASRNATSTTGVFSFERYRQTLTRPMGRGPSLIDMMTQNGVMSNAESTRLNLILGDAAKIENALAGRARLDEVVANPSALFDLVVRGIGANIGGQLGGGTGAPLVMAGAGVRTAQNLLERMPLTRMNDVMVEASKNPRFMAALLERPQSVERTRELTMQINAYLMQAGIVQNEPVTRDEVEQTE